MERENDVQLIRRILSGNDEAFSVLVRKHQKSIHALAWRKVGDFHIAEEITQDTFLQGIQEPRAAEKSEPVWRMDLCYRE